MKHRGNRLLSVLLTLCMVLSLFAGTMVTASAEEANEVPGQAALPNDPNDDPNVDPDADPNPAGETPESESAPASGSEAEPQSLTTPGTGTVTTRTEPLYLANGSLPTGTGITNENGIYECAAEGWSYDSNTKVLTLSGVNFDITTSEKWYGICADHIVLADGTENYVTLHSSYAEKEKYNVAAIFTGKISGSGSLTVSVSAPGGCVGISNAWLSGTPYNNIALEQCSITVDGVTSQNGYARGIYANFGRSISITPNDDKSNKIEIKNIHSAGSRTAYAIEGYQITATGAYVSGAKVPFADEANWINFKDSSTPVILTFVQQAAIFYDGFDDMDCTFDSYTEGAKNSRGYAFAGWFDSNGTKLTNAGSASRTETYTAQWINNGKTVRTSVLNLVNAATQTNDDEGWSWDAASKTLTLNGCTIDVPETGRSEYAAIDLPDGATILTNANTTNTVINHSVAGPGSTGALAWGSLTIKGSGQLSVTGRNGGISAISKLAIQAPVTAACTEECFSAIQVVNSDGPDAKIELDSSLRIKTPTGGKIVSTVEDDIGVHRAFISTSSNTTDVREVVIEYGSSTVIVVEPSTPASNPTAPVNNPATGAAEPGHTGLALAAAALLAGGAVLASRKHQEF